MRKKQIQYWLSGICFLILFFILYRYGYVRLKTFVCKDPIGCVTIAPGEPVRLGMLQALSGKVAPLGIGQVRGMELALDARNHQILGHPVELRTEDTDCTGEGGTVAAMKIVSDPKYIAIFGTTCSSAAATAAKVMSEAGLVMISGNNSAPFLTSLNGEYAPRWQPGYFRTAQNEEHSGKAAAFFAFEKLGLRKAAIVNDGDIYTTGLTEGFRQKFEEMGGKIVFASSVSKGDSNMEPLVTAIKNSEAEILFFPLFQPEGNLVVREFRKHEDAESRKIALMSDGALIEKTFIEDMGKEAEGIYFVGPASPPKSPEVLALEAAYGKKYGESPYNTYYLNAYDAANLLFAAIEKTAFRDDDGSLHIGRQALRDELYGTRDFPGVTALLSCDRFGDCISPEFKILRLDDAEKGIAGLESNVLFLYAPDK
ncbi:MAG: branched-chain amino acid ABC transporter substrate-binding protein [Desulfobacterales bacterium]